MELHLTTNKPLRDGFFNSRNKAGIVYNKHPKYCYQKQVNYHK